MSEPRCTHCRQPIGVYEPLIRVREGHPRESSRAAEPDVLRVAEPCYHRNCFEQLHGAPDEG